MSKRTLTPDQIASIPALLTAGETPVSLGAKWGFHRGAIHYHASGGKRARALRLMGRMPRPWRAHMAKAKKSEQACDYAAAAMHLRKAAELLSVSK